MSRFNKAAWSGIVCAKACRRSCKTSKAIKAGVRTHNEDETAEDEFEEGEVEDAVKTLYTVMDKLDERLIDKLDEA